MNESTVKRSSFSGKARRVGEEIGIDWSSRRSDVEQFRTGMDVEFEHGFHDLLTNVTGDEPIVTGKIALAHLREFPDYYTRERGLGSCPTVRSRTFGAGSLSGRSTARRRRTACNDERRAGSQVAAGRR